MACNQPWPCAEEHPACRCVGDAEEVVKRSKILYGKSLLESRDNAM
jgi:hypothetical protein